MRSNPGGAVTDFVFIQSGGDSAFHWSCILLGFAVAFCRAESRSRWIAEISCWTSSRSLLKQSNPPSPLPLPLYVCGHAAVGALFTAPTASFEELVCTDNVLSSSISWKRVTFSS